MFGCCGRFIQLCDRVNFNHPEGLDDCSMFVEHFEAFARGGGAHGIYSFVGNEAGLKSSWLGGGVSLVEQLVEETNCGVLVIDV